ncbi:hypothetical protein LOAG_02756 [Loa loa]|uniref:Uncharacterized protein n=1 Tax=Loa loa TaxID=7209 RepID=A0A1I7V7F6_LOALO|nr:hypothetical protein LOAG_02756 [Loa loa]EFO25729.2 hypothetical protein LOAG_02756 [Loa loa]
MLPQRNISITVKNETGEGHWYPPPPQPQPLQPLQPLQPISPMYGETIPFSYPYGYAPPGYYPYTSCYPPASCSNTVPLALDQFYCSAHGSFALGTGEPSNKLMREFCRFTATANENSCNTCCKIAARHYTTSVDEVHGIMFAFDPNKPPIQTYPKPPRVSLLRKRRALKTGTSTEANPIKPSIKMQNAEQLAVLPGLIPIGGSITSSSNDIPQCFCCAPMRSTHAF